MPANSDATVVDINKSASIWILRVQSVVNRDRCWYALLMCQFLKLVGQENIPLFCIRHDESLIVGF